MIPEVWNRYFVQARLQRDELKLTRKLRSLRHMGSTRVQVGSHELLNFATNDYLGLSGDLRIAEAAASAAGRFGWGTSSSRLVTGSSNLHAKLETETAAFRGRESALLFGSGYQANLGVISALAEAGDTIFSDAMNHASIVAGCKLSGANVRVFKHRDYDDLERKLNSATGRKVVVTDTMFSIEGDTAELPRLVKLCERFSALLILDDAHGHGAIGKRGRGIPEEQNCVGQAAVVVGTYSKAMGSYGGFVCCDEVIREHLINTSRPFMYTTSLPIALVAANIEAVKIVRTEGEGLRQKLAHNVKLLRARLEQAEFKLTGKHHIIGVPADGPERVLFMAEQLESAGILAYPMRWPSVPKGRDCLRISVTAGMDEESLARLIAALKMARDRMVGKDTSTTLRRESKRPTHQNLETHEPMADGGGFADDDTDFFAGGPMAGPISAADSARTAAVSSGSNRLPPAESVHSDFAVAAPSASDTLIPGTRLVSEAVTTRVTAGPATPVGNPVGDDNGESSASQATEGQAEESAGAAEASDVADLATGGSVRIVQSAAASEGGSTDDPAPDASATDDPAGDGTGKITAEVSTEVSTEVSGEVSTEVTTEVTTVEDESDDDTDEHDLLLEPSKSAGETLAPEPTELADPEIVDIEGRTRSRKKRKSRTRAFKPGERG